jgi:hypothetical protein
VTTMWCSVSERPARDYSVRLGIPAAAAAIAVETASDRANSYSGPADSGCTQQISSPRSQSGSLAGARIMILNPPDCAGRDIDLTAGMRIRRRIDLGESLAVTNRNRA